MRCQWKPCQSTHNAEHATNDFIIECIAGTRSVDEYDAVLAEFFAEGGAGDDR